MRKLLILLLAALPLGCSTMGGPCTQSGFHIEYLKPATVTMQTVTPVSQTTGPVAAMPIAAFAGPTTIAAQQPALGITSSRPVLAMTAPDDCSCPAILDRLGALERRLNTLPAPRPLPPGP